MKSIYASKLYKASNRKDRIHAALIAPSNLALIQQLAEDLDEEYQTPENFGLEEESNADTSDVSTEDLDLDEFVVDEEVDPENDLVTMNDFSKSAGGHSISHKSSGSGSSSSDESNSQPEAPAEESSDKPKSDTSELIPESPANEQKPADSSTNAAQDQENIKATIALDLNVLKATLNSRGDTSGVSRIAEKDNEIWIYYNDEVNLNNIMTDVIEYMMTSGCENFEFNRLARSDNAIVFVTDIKSTSADLESIDPAETKVEV